MTTSFKSELGCDNMTVSLYYPFYKVDNMHAILNIEETIRAIVCWMALLTSISHKPYHDQARI